MEIKTFKKTVLLQKFIKDLSNNTFYIILNSEKRLFKTITQLFVFNEEDVKKYFTNKWHDLLEKLQIKEFEETIVIKNNHIYVNIKCDNKNTIFSTYKEHIIIALQKLLIIYLEIKFKKSYFITINLNNYINKQKYLLKNRIYNIMKRMKYNQEPFHFEPMSSNQRKIIHELVRKIDGIVSYSLGNEQNRHVVIKLKNLEQTKDLSL